MARSWPALLVEAGVVDDAADRVWAVLDDHAPAAVEDLTEIPLPPGGVWDPTCPAVPEPSPAPLHWRVFFTCPADRDRAAEALAQACPDLRLSRTDVGDEDWVARSQRALSAVEAGRFVVAPPLATPGSVPRDRTLIVIEPSMGFGTGHHPTTRLCLRLLSDLDVRGLRILDVGTGSGVLAMAAALCGAAAVVGLDVDEDAIEAARASAALNALPPVVRWEVGDFRTSPPAPADVVLANLTGGMLRTAAGVLMAMTRPGGVLVMSGFDEAEAGDVCAAFAALRERARLEEAGWVGAAFARPHVSANIPLRRTLRASNRLRSADRPRFERAWFEPSWS